MTIIDLQILRGIADKELESFTDYADRHELFSILQQMVRQLVISKPSDPLAWMAKHLETHPQPAVLVMAPPMTDSADLCRLLAKAMRGAIHVSAGGLLRTAIERKTNLGTQATAAYSKNQLVADRVVIELVQLRLMQSDAVSRGWVLEGFPKTREQAIALLRKGVIPSHVIWLDWPDRLILDRAAQRVVDPVTNAEYDLSVNPPTDPDVRARLTRKAAYSEANVRERLMIYRRNLPSVLECFKSIIQVPVHESAVPRVLNPQPPTESPTRPRPGSSSTKRPGSAASPSGTRPGSAARTLAPARPVPKPMTTVEGQLDFIRKELQVRQEVPSTLVHRVILCGGDELLRHAICLQVEAMFDVVYASPRRVMCEELSLHGPRESEFSDVLLDKAKLEDWDVASLMHGKLQSPGCVKRGWIAICDPGEWTGSLLDGLAALKVAPTRVVYLQNYSAETPRTLLPTLQQRFRYADHPFFGSVDGSKGKSGGVSDQFDGEIGTLQEIEVSNEIESCIATVCQALARPIDYKVPRLY